MAIDDKDHAPEAIDNIDNPEWTEANYARAVPIAQLFPEQAAALKKQGGRPRLAQPKVQMTFRLSADVAQAVQNTGKGYNGRVDAVLRDAISRGVL